MTQLIVPSSCKTDEIRYDDMRKYIKEHSQGEKFIVVTVAGTSKLGKSTFATALSDIKHDIDHGNDQKTYGAFIAYCGTKEHIAKKNGYILVKFDIVGKNGAEDYLRYTGPESITEPGKYEDGKKWQDPSGNPDPINPNQPVQLPNEKPETIPDGIVIMFETDFKANNDYEVIGTH